MFHYDRGLFLTRTRLAVDVTRHQAYGFVSHAHADHMARHGMALCTPETAKLYRHRLGQRRTRELPYGQEIDWHGQRLTALPAGHCLGSAMLLAKEGDQTLLYTGDFKLAASETAGAAMLRTADTLIMECTFGRPQFRLPPREEVLGSFVLEVRRTLERDQTPIICAYALGKAQEVTRVLTRAGLRVQQSPEVYAISRIYEECGVDLGTYEPLAGEPASDVVVVTPPHRRRALRFRRNAAEFSFAVTGWSHDTDRPIPWQCDRAVPLSDHADYGELLETVERVGAKRIYCLHGPAEFAARLRQRGHQAEHLPNR